MAESTLSENPIQALLTVLGVAVVCALLVSVSAVKLRPHYVANLEAHRLAQLESILSALSGTVHEVAAENIESRLVELTSGRYSDKFDPATFDARKAATDPGGSTPIPPDHDIAGIQRREKHATVFLVRDADGGVALIILPVRGSGYQSSLYGFLALAGDTSTVVALKFYEQGDTLSGLALPGAGLHRAPWMQSIWSTASQARLAPARVCMICCGSGSVISALGHF
jgi:Na+-transporting NADH:ubiquinone oxidoreductase subunit C